MRTPEHRAQPRVGKKFETELDMHYLSPGAFTVLPLDVNRLPDPPPAPPPYRLPTTTRRFKHPSFAIIGEAASSSPNSRSSSPTGRVSPFRGRGFNAAGSRHVSPSASPIPPEDPRTRSPSPTKTASSKIPKPRKSSTAAVFGEKVNHVEFQGLSRQGSQSLSSLEERQTRGKPPPSPRKKLTGAFKQLSPIQGSSPEPSQSQSSPSRIPTKSQSTPPSRYASPTREPKAKRSRSRPSVAKSRDPSPLASPTKANRYQHVQSKINTFNRPRPPAKPQLSSDVSEDSGSPKKKVQPRRNSFNRTPSRPNLLPKTYMGKPSSYTSDSSDAVDVRTPPVKPPAAKPPAAAAANKVLPAPNASSSPSKSKAPPRAKGPKGADRPAKTGNNRRPSKASPAETSGAEDQSSRKAPPSADLEDGGAPSALGVVSSTTSTVATPLKIETPKLGRGKPMSPMIDGRVLSATSVSHAINKMNDTVLNTQTLIKDSGLPTRLPAASAIIALKSDSSAKEVEDSGKSSINSKPEATTIAPKETSTPTTTTTAANEEEAATNPTCNSAQPAKVPDYPQSKPMNNNHSNHVTTIGLGNAKAIEREVQNNMNRLLGSMESSLDGVPASKMSVNDRIREARTVIAADVKPIRITVREKPSDVDVQSGNVGPHFGIANGVNERPR
ncbi:serine/arginine repetitive matrix protein 1-like [Dendroctonus ponderosae]|uniref:serine/arginine repetitive matrix protein 1-like n=1 Tax=Dendroctonus ponderosae TaxID=77166 RepID=UPI002034C70D|nr:serine/arginine repetitive matrix protein 1-like [Dendroctonus ponderosae]XP_048519107.1 serine/arginine repetitive matrix protein 1-like [Dendroctonus ponderosae]